MHYPFWYVPGLTAPMLIAIVAVAHILVASYAVGGGFFLAIEVRHAYRTGNHAYLEYLRGHAWFFILLTEVLGAITGVGIWWAIGLASPLPTSYLINTFVFGWGMEYVTFIVEIVSAFLFFYLWGKVPALVHQRIGFIYAWSAWLSLVIITGITSFMLQPGAWQGNFWLAMANPQALPQIMARTGASLLLATLYVYLHASFRAKPAGMREMIAKRAGRPAMLGAALITVGGLLWLALLPPSALMAIEGAATLNILVALIFVISGTLFAMFYFGAYRNPGWLSPGFAIVLLAMGFMVTGAGEFVREAVRKPFVIYGEVYSHNLMTAQVKPAQTEGFLQTGVWTRHHVTREFPSVMDESGRVVSARLLELSLPDKVRVGETLYHHHCGSCHALSGYSGLRGLLRGRDREMLRGLIANMDRYHFLMPPWSGTAEEAEVLKEYLATIALPHPFRNGGTVRRPSGPARVDAGDRSHTGG